MPIPNISYASVKNPTPATMQTLTWNHLYTLRQYICVREADIDEEVLTRSPLGRFLRVPRGAASSKRCCLLCRMWRVARPRWTRTPHRQRTSWSQSSGCRMRLGVWRKRDALACGRWVSIVHLRYEVRETSGKHGFVSSRRRSHGGIRRTSDVSCLPEQRVRTGISCHVSLYAVLLRWCRSQRHRYSQGVAPTYSMTDERWSCSSRGQCRWQRCLRLATP